ncbi:MAG: PIN domain-containing protein [Planctomycetaceae bacterium]|nr:PIN domain-containing protein [Planctomycetaceae bacterium]
MIKICFDSSALGKLLDLPLLDSKNFLATDRLLKSMINNRKNFDLFISPVFITELIAAPSKIRTATAIMIKKLNMSIIPTNPQAESLAKFYLQQKVLPKNSLLDLLHIAYASIAECDFLLSFDNHFLREKTVNLVSKINREQNIFVPKIISPLTFLEQWEKK